MPDAAKVHVYDDGVLKNTFTVDGSGNWSGQITGVTAGASTIGSKAEDLAGNISSQTNKKVYTGSTTTPGCDLLDDSGESSSDKITNDDTPRIKVLIGFGSEYTAMGDLNLAAASVSALILQHSDDGGTTWNTVETNNSPSFNGSKNFEFIHQVAVALGDGDHKFRAAWTDARGTQSAWGAVLTITVDTTAPNAPAVTDPADGQVFIGTTIDMAGTAS
ncbi:MAG: hypothetical protein K9N34_03690 [Candidatus Marinimicrobia bacterium]|nr:hypothetical protein [Candidatus Neomarinimicrobiota bacterium]